uniref:Uncharacterized protein n=1 Tax=Arundo donax TaxID=35708 RepID=A0A0A9EDQ9_ARUDO
MKGMEKEVLIGRDLARN